MRLCINHDLVDITIYTHRTLHKGISYLYVCFNCKQHKSCYLYRTHWAPMCDYKNYRDPICYPFRIDTIF